MRKLIGLCSLAVFLSACAPSGNPVLRSREERRYPDPTLGTENLESQQYKTQILAAPSVPGASTATSGAAINGTTAPAPAALPKTPVPTQTPAPGTAATPSAGI